MEIEEEEEEDTTPKTRAHNADVAGMESSGTVSSASLLRSPEQQEESSPSGMGRKNCRGIVRWAEPLVAASTVSPLPVLTDEEFLYRVNMLHQGRKCALKHGRRGRPHRRFLVLSPDNNRLYWSDKARTGSELDALKSKRFMDLRFSHLLMGKDTPTYRHFLERGEEWQHPFLLSVVHNDSSRSLDVEVESFKEQMYFFLTLERIVEEKQPPRPPASFL